MKRQFGALVVGIALLVPASAGAVTTKIGQPIPAGTSLGTTIGCAMGCSYFQESVAPGTLAYTVPAAPATGPWTVTAWSAGSGAGTSNATLQLWRPTGVTGQFRLFAQSASTSLPDLPLSPAPASNPVSIPVQPGDIVGIHGDTSNFPVEYLAPGNTAHLVGGDAAVGDTSGAPGSTFPGSSDPGYLANVGATLTAPDAPIAKKKCKKKKGKKKAAAAKKKSCKKKKKK
jgi:hypothetical protein